MRVVNINSALVFYTGLKPPSMPLLFPYLSAGIENKPGSNSHGQSAISAAMFQNSSSSSSREVFFGHGQSTRHGSSRSNVKGPVRLI